MNKLYKFYWDCGRMGHLSGIFVADDEAVKEVIGKEIYFGEVLGKHSEIFGYLDEKDLTVLTDDQVFIKKFLELDCECGRNPINYLPEEELDAEKEEDE